MTYVISNMTYVMFIYFPAKSLTYKEKCAHKLLEVVGYERESTPN